MSIYEICAGRRGALRGTPQEDTKGEKRIEEDEKEIAGK
jgi:hypothetical protein